MRKIIMALFLIVVLLAALVACENDVTIAVRDEKVIEITSADELASISQYLGEEYKNYVFELKKDIDLSGRIWTPIGNSAENSFRGKFNGNGWTVRGLTFGGLGSTSDVNEITFNYAGLFGYTFNASIKNLNLSDINVSFYGQSEYTHTGGLIGYAYGNTTLKDISASNITIHTGTYTKAVFVEHGEDDFTINIICDQTQYLGGLVGYSSGKLSAENVELSQVSIETLKGTLVPQFDRDDKGDYLREQTGIELDTAQNLNEYYADNVFAGAFVGYAKGITASDIMAEDVFIDAYGKSVVTGTVFGAVYDGALTDTKFDGSDVRMRIDTKGLAGGLSGLLDASFVSEIEGAENALSVAFRSVNLQSVALGGIVGYLNDYSIIEKSSLEDVRIYTQPNISGTGNRNYPVVGGIAGTMRNSTIRESTVGGGIYKSTENALDIPVDENYTLSAGIVATVYGNSHLSDCTADIYAFSGILSSVVPIEYVNGEGLAMLRFAKSENYSNYIGISSRAEGTTLICDFTGVDGEIFASYEYESFAGDISDLNSLIENYFDEGSLLDPYGNAVVMNGKRLEGYVLVTGKALIENLTYNAEKIVNVPENDTVDGSGIATMNTNGYNG